MSKQLSIATRYEVVLSDSILTGDAAMNALSAIFYEFCVEINYGEMSGGDVQIERDELIHLRDTIDQGGEDFDEYAVIFREQLGRMNLSQDEFLAMLDRLIKESDQRNGYVHLCWA